MKSPPKVWIRIDSGELIEPFNGIRGDFRKWGLAAFACELIQELVPLRDPNRQTYALLRQTLEILDREKGDPEIGPLFQLKLLQLAGYGLSFEACQACGKRGRICRRPYFYRAREGCSAGNARTGKAEYRCRRGPSKV